jgi:serine O-acetyltransferase
MIQNKKDLKLYLSEDAHRAGITNRFVYWAKLIYGNEQAHSLKYLRILRLYEYHYNNDNDFLKYWYRIRHSRLGLKYGIHIGINMIGYGFWMPHFTGGVIINCKSMGNYCSANGGVVVGNKGNQDNRATIGDYVKLSIGVKVYGKITIGNHVIITPNSVIYKDVSSNVIISSIASTIVVKKGNVNDNIYYFDEK